MEVADHPVGDLWGNQLRAGNPPARAPPSAGRRAEHDSQPLRLEEGGSVWPRCFVWRRRRSQRAVATWHMARDHWPSLASTDMTWGGDARVRRAAAARAKAGGLGRTGSAASSFAHSCSPSLQASPGTAVSRARPRAMPGRARDAPGRAAHAPAPLRQRSQEQGVAQNAGAVAAVDFASDAQAGDGGGDARHPLPQIRIARLALPARAPQRGRAGHARLLD